MADIVSGKSPIRCLVVIIREGAGTWKRGQLVPRRDVVDELRVSVIGFEKQTVRVSLFDPQVQPMIIRLADVRRDDADVTELRKRP
jgi:hypothetical protein